MKKLGERRDLHIGLIDVGKVGTLGDDASNKDDEFFDSISESA